MNDIQYFKSGTWECVKSPVGAHHWIINDNMMKCKYCHEERFNPVMKAGRSFSNLHSPYLRGGLVPAQRRTR